MNFAGRLGMFVIGVLVLLAAPPTLGAAEEAGDRVAQIRARLDQLERQAVQPAGRAVYRAACATCHGINGDGRGSEGAGLDFPPTDFRRGVYKLRTTAFEMLPTGADLIRSIREGLPGTDMVPFKGILTEGGIRSVAAYISAFSHRFADPKETEDAQESLIKIPAARPAATPESVEAGREVYEREECGTCHGEDGDGHGPDAKGMTDDLDRPIFMFDWRAGVFKSGRHDQDLYRSIASGMNGTPMEAYAEDTTAEERWQLVDFIRSLETRKGFFYALFAEQPSGTNYR